MREEELLVLRWDDDGMVELTLDRRGRRHRRSRPRDVAGVEHGAGDHRARVVGARVDLVFAALADPSRRFVLERLARGSASQSELAGELPVTRQAVAKHLATLRAAGLVHAERRGRETRYELESAPLGDAAAGSSAWAPNGTSAWPRWRDTSTPAERSRRA